MANKDHLPTNEENTKRQKRDLKRIVSTNYQSAPPVLTQDITDTGTVSRTTGEVRDTDFPILKDIADLTDNLQTIVAGSVKTIQVELGKQEAQFQRLLLDDDSGSVTEFIIDFIGLAKNKALEFIADIETVFTGTPIITFNPPLTGLPSAFGDTGNNKFKMLVSAIETPAITSYQVINGEGGSTLGASFPILWPKENLTPISGGTATIDISLITGNAKQIQFPAGDINFLIGGDPTGVVAQSVVVIFIQDGVGGRSLTTVDSAIKNGSLMDTVLDKAPNAKTTFRFTTHDQGTTYHAELVDLSTGATITSLNDLSDVSTAGVVLGNSLIFNGTLWTAAFVLLSTINIDADKAWGGQNITDMGSISSNADFLGDPGFIRMGTGEEIRMRNAGNTDDLVITSKNIADIQAQNVQAIVFQVAGGDRLSIGNFQMDVNENKIVNTGDILPGAGSGLSVGVIDNAYSQMHADFFLPSPASVINSRHGLARTGETLYINFDDSNDALFNAGFGIYGEGEQRFLFRQTVQQTGVNTPPTTSEFFIGNAETFTAGEKYLITMGEGSHFATISLTEGTGNDLILDRRGGGVNTGIKMEVNGLAITRFLSDSVILFRTLDANFEDLINVVDIKSDAAGTGPSTGTIGELITLGGGFNYFMRDTLAWESDEDTKLTFGIAGITLETNGNNDDIDILAKGTGSQIGIRAEDVLDLGLIAAIHLQFASGITQFFNANIALSAGAQTIQFNDAVVDTAVTDPAAGDITLFNNATTSKLSIKKPGDIVVSLEEEGALWSTFKAIADVDMDTFDINTIDRLLFQDAASSIETGTEVNKGFSSLLNGIRVNILNDGDFQITEEEVLHFEYRGIGNIVRVVDAGFTVHNTLGDEGNGTDFNIVKQLDSTEITEPNLMIFNIGNAEIMRLETGNLTMANGISIANADQIGFSAIGNVIEDTDLEGLRFVTRPFLAGVLPENPPQILGQFTWANGVDGVGTPDVYATLDIDGLHLNNMYLQLDGITAAVVGGTGGDDVGRLFINTTNSNHFSIVRNETIIDLEAGGDASTWSEFPATEEVDFDGNDVKDMGKLDFNEPGNDIEAVGQGMFFSTNTNDEFRFGIGGFLVIQLGLSKGLQVRSLPIEFSSIAIPGNAPSGRGNLFMDTTNSGHISFKRAGSVIDLESGGGGDASQWATFIAVADIDVGTFDIKNVDRIFFAVDTKTISGSSRAIVGTDEGMSANVPSENGYRWLSNMSPLMGVFHEPTTNNTVFEVISNDDGAVPEFKTLSLDTELVAGVAIARMEFAAHNSTVNFTTVYAGVQIDLENFVTTEEEGSLTLLATAAGSQVAFLSINNSADGNITAFRDLVIDDGRNIIMNADADILLNGNQLKLDTNGTNLIDGPTSAVNITAGGGLVAVFNSTTLTLQPAIDLITRGVLLGPTTFNFTTDGALWLDSSSGKLMGRDGGVDFELSGTGGANGHVIQDEGSSLTQRTNLNFVGAGVAVTDIGSVTTVTIAGGGGDASAWSTFIATQTVDFSDEDATGIDRLLFAVSSGAFVDGTVKGFVASNAALLANVPAGDHYELSINNVRVLTLDISSDDTRLDIYTKTDGGVPKIRMFNQDPSPTISTQIAELDFLAKNDNDDNIFYARVSAEIENFIDDDEAGSLDLRAATGGTLSTFLSINNSNDGNITAFRDLVMATGRDIVMAAAGTSNILLNDNQLILNDELDNIIQGGGDSISITADGTPMAVFSATQLTLQTDIDLLSRVVFHDSTTFNVTVNGAIWFDGTNLKGREGGADFLLSAGGGGGVDLLPLNNTWTGTNDFTQLVDITSNVVGVDAILRLVNNDITLSPPNVITRIEFVGKNDNGTPEDIDYASIFGVMEDDADGLEEGGLSLRAIHEGNQITFIRLNDDGGDGLIRFNRPIKLSADSLFIDFREDVAGTSLDAPPGSNDIRLFNDEDNGKLSVKKNNGAVIPLENFPLDFPELEFSPANSSRSIPFGSTFRHARKYNLNTNLTFSFSAQPTDKTAYVNIIVVQDNTGGRTVTLPAGTVNKDIVESGILLGSNEETGIVIKWSFGTFYAFLETGNTVSGGGSGGASALSDLTIDTNKDWETFNITNIGDVIPNGDSVETLGDATHRWDTLFVEKIKGSTITIDNTVSTFSISASTINIGNTTGDDIDFKGRAISDLVPKTTAAHDLGIATKDWKDLWIRGIKSGLSTIVESPIFSIQSPQITIGGTKADTITMNGTIETSLLLQDVSPTQPDATTGKIFARQSGGVSSPFWLDSDNNETSMLAGGATSGNLSDLTIDVKKDWDAKGITNLGELLGVTKTIFTFGVGVTLATSVITQTADALEIDLIDGTDKFEIEFGNKDAFRVDSGKTEILSTTPDVTSAELSLFRNDSNPMANDVIGEIVFRGNSASPPTEGTEYGRIEMIVNNATVGSLESSMKFFHRVNNLEVNIFTLKDGKVTVVKNSDAPNDIAEIDLIKEDTSPGVGDFISSIKSVILDGTTPTTFSSIVTSFDSSTSGDDAANIAINILADDALITAINIRASPISQKIAFELIDESFIEPISGQIGLFVIPTTLSDPVGTEGTNQMPADPLGGIVTISLLNLKFGAEVGSFGMLGTGVDRAIYVKTEEADGRWGRFPVDTHIVAS